MNLQEAKEALERATEGARCHWELQTQTPCDGRWCRQPGEVRALCWDLTNHGEDPSALVLTMVSPEGKVVYAGSMDCARALGDREPGPMGDAEALAWCAREVRRLDALLASQRLPELSMP